MFPHVLNHFRTVVLELEEDTVPDARSHGDRGPVRQMLWAWGGEVLIRDRPSVSKVAARC